MPHYYFHVRDDGQGRIAPVGMVLPDLREARRAGFVLAGTLLSGPTRRFWHLDTWAIDVLDESDTVLVTLIFFRSMAAVMSVPPRTGTQAVLH